MQDRRSMGFCKQHIEELNKKLEEIYSITEKENGKDEKKERKINVAKEIDKLEYFENIYSVIEKEGIPQGDTYEKYNGYLLSVREALKEYKKVKEEIEKNNMEEIKNINLLLKAFQEKI